MSWVENSGGLEFLNCMAQGLHSLEKYLTLEGSGIKLGGDLGEIVALGAEILS